MVGGGDQSDVIAALRAAIERCPNTASGLARAAGLDRSLLSRILSGQRTLTAETVDRLVAALNEWALACRDAATLLDPAAAPGSERSEMPPLVRNVSVFAPSIVDHHHIRASWSIAAPRTILSVHARNRRVPGMPKLDATNGGGSIPGAWLGSRLERR